MHFLNTIFIHFSQGQCLLCKRRESIRPVAPRAAAELVSLQWKGAWDQLFAFQGVTTVRLFPFSKVSPGKNCWGFVFLLSGRPKGLEPHAKGRLRWETLASPHGNAQAGDLDVFWRVLLRWCRKQRYHRPPERLEYCVSKLAEKQKRQKINLLVVFCWAYLFISLNPVVDVHINIGSKPQ